MLCRAVVKHKKRTWQIEIVNEGIVWRRIVIRMSDVVDTATAILVVWSLVKQYISSEQSSAASNFKPTSTLSLHIS